MFEVSKGVLSAPQRRIAYDTAGKFLELQRELHRSNTSPAGRSQQEWTATLAFSKAVSSILESTDDAEPTPEDIQASQERALWDLISLFALDSQATTQDTLFPDLSRWLLSNAISLAGSPAASPFPHKLAASLQETAIPESHPEYWPTLKRLVALGWIADALEILGLHSAWLQWGSAGENPEIDSQVAVLEAATLLLRRMPSVRGRGASKGSTTREFDSLQECLTYRTSWQQQCNAVLEDTALWEQCESNASETAENVKNIIYILSGNETAVTVPTKTWAELLVAKLLHIHPELHSLAELRQLLHDCIEERALSREIDHLLAAVLDACCEGDSQTALRACSVLASDWLMAHVPTILASHPSGASLLSRELAHLGTNQIEFYALEFAAALAPHATTWPLAASYLSWCEAYGQCGFYALVERLPYDASNPALALKASELCLEQDLESLEALVIRNQGAACWQHGHLGGALTWLTKIRDIERIDEVIKPLASEIWSSGASTALQTVKLMKESIDAVPAGSTHHAMVQVKTLLGNTSNTSDIDGAVHLLKQLPQSQLEQCLGAVLTAAPTADPSKVSSEAVMQLLEWLESYGKDFGHQAVARLALVRLLVATHAAGTPEKARRAPEAAVAVAER
ncbi:putative Nuclear pore complex protein NUP85 [Nannochloris sp. 'desiccata']|nr:putative Nuclear pore complex protein NUP85 [Chlorella desiccata (nom. nud.)]